ncbi:SRPBCC family protein [Kitasatospora sp. NPDC050543]|uniref:SRPBCC family protein n=1 Tax=Kitasatospora sp. NPDC050543 TaxID=3364054 RepID=UPI00379DDAE2
MHLTHYRFSCVWQLDAAPAAVHAALEDIAGYPAWWPQVRAFRQLGERSGEVVIRSLLPYSLTLTLHDARAATAPDVLAVTMSGDLQGWSRWTLTPHAGGTRALFEEECRTGRPLLRRLALPARPLLRANHAAMMRAGRRGLRAHLAGR